MSKGLKLVHKAVLLVGIPLAVQLTCYSILYMKLVEADKEREREAHQKEIVLQFNNLYRTMVLFSAGTTGNFLVRGDQYDGRTASSEQVLNSSYEKLEELVKDDPKLRQDAKELKASIVELMAMGRKVKEIASFGHRLEALVMMKDVKAMLRKISVQMDKTLAGMERIQTQKVDTHERQRRTVTAILGAGVAFDIAIALFGAFWVIGRWTGRLNRLVKNTREVAEGRRPTEPLAGTDEIAELDQSFFEMSRALDAAEKRKQELISMVTHDLRAPLTSVRATLALLESGACGSLPEPALDKVNIADRNLERLISLINDLLAIEKMKAGKLDLNVDIVDLSAILKRSADSMRGLAEPRGISIVLPKTEAQVLADGDRIVQVVVNILANALKFSPDDSTISISVVEAETECTVRIADQGKGIPPEYLEKIFQPFEQVKGDQKKGTGLGLSIVKAIVEQHGGRVGLESEVGAGSTFWFSLPTD